MRAAGITLQPTAGEGMTSGIQGPASRSARVRQAEDALAGAGVVFQPIVSVATGSLVALEGLTRMAPSAGVALEDVLEVARNAGFGLELEAQCVRAALALRDTLPSGTLVAVNLSPEGLRVLASTTFWPADVTGVIIEITEQDAPDLDEIELALGPLRERGAALAVDDVGSGYAGLLRIADLRPDYVKVDKQILSHAADANARIAVLDALVTFSHRLGAAVIAEGVEDVADIQLLAELDVDYAQGYGIGQPSWPTRPVADHVVRACRAARQRVLDGPTSAPPAAARTRDIYAVTATLRSADNAGGLTAAINAAAVELGVTNIGVSVIGVDNAFREIAASGGRRADPRRYPLADYPASAGALSAGATMEIHLDDPTGDAAEQDVLRSFGQASLLLVPIVLDGEALGAVELTNTAPRRWSSSDIAYTQGLASHLGPVLARLGVVDG
jgi:EAL domain-containing protein (putative c-di-GMP-specific phosphodiesterase class I)